MRASTKQGTSASGWTNSVSGKAVRRQGSLLGERVGGVQVFYYHGSARGYDDSQTVLRHSFSDTLTQG